jgi:hypothetical protein
VDLFNAKFLFASLIWGSVGFGYFIYGKKQSTTWPMIGGIAMMALSYVIASWALMSVFCVLIIAAVYQLHRRGY